MPTAPELAQILAIPEGTVRSRIQRGKERLRRELAKMTTQKTVVHRSVELLDRGCRP